MITVDQKDVVAGVRRVQFEAAIDAAKIGSGE